MSTGTAAPATTLSLPGIAYEQARRDPERTVFTALDRDGRPATTLTAAQYDTAARMLAGHLSTLAAPGERVLVPAMTGLQFQIAFLACLYAGLIAVPLPPAAAVRRRDGHRGNRYARLIAICRDTEPALAVVPTDRVDRMAEVWADEEALRTVTVVGTDPGTDVVPVAGPMPVDPQSVAFLQYTSGSTSAPRGVLITHRALLANMNMMRVRGGCTGRTTFVSWLPVYHDMGLSLGLLLPLYCGARAVVMEPDTFVVRPERWLRALSGVPDVMSAAPDSAYRWCLRRVPEDAREGLDLSGWRVGLNGAEPVRAETLRDFHRAFAPYGLREQTLAPAYGLAESTVFVTGGSGTVTATIRRYDRDELGRGRAVPAPDSAAGVELVSCGLPGQDVEVLVVDPDTARRLPAGTVGEIWIRSPSNGAGYWRRPDDSRHTFGAVPAGGPDRECWLRTGDLGFLDGGELYVTGRQKDMLIVHGANYYPQDFEWLAGQAHPLLAAELAIACPGADDDRVTVAVECDRRADDLAAVATAALRAITAELPVATEVVLVPRGQLPRTTSGKAQRQECARRLADGTVRVLAQAPERTGTRGERP